MGDMTMQSVGKYAPSVAGAMGTALQVKGDLETANASARAARVQAAQLRQNAKQQVAAATFAAQEAQREKDLIASRAIALAAASGGGVTDPTVIRILQGIEREGALKTEMALYNGLEEARGMNAKASAVEYEGAMARRMYRSRAMSTAMSGATKLATTWGQESFADSQQRRGTLDAGSSRVSDIYA